MQEVNKTNQYRNTIQNIKRERNHILALKYTKSVMELQNTDLIINSHRLNDAKKASEVYRSKLGLLNRYKLKKI